MVERKQDNLRRKGVLEKLQNIAVAAARHDTSQQTLLEEITAQGRTFEPRTSEDRSAFVQLVTDALRPGLYVEIGNGVNPYTRTTVRSFSEMSPYIGVDVKQHNTPTVPYTEYIVGDGTALNFSSNSSQEVFMGNILLSPGTDVQTQLHLLTEAERVLDPQTGVLVIAENEVFYDHPKRFGILGLLLEEAGFADRIYVDPSDPLFDKLHDLYGWQGFNSDLHSSRFVDPNCQYIIAKPEKHMRKRKKTIGEILFKRDPETVQDEEPIVGTGNTISNQEALDQRGSLLRRFKNKSK